MGHSRVLRAVLLVLLGWLSVTAWADPPTCLQSSSDNARVNAVAEDFSAMAVQGTGDCSNTSKNLTIPTNDIRNLLKNIMKVQAGDHLRIQFSDAGLNNVSFASSDHIPAKERWSLLVGTALLLFLLATALTKGHPLRLLIGKDNRYSNSQTQAVVWFWIVISSYVATLILRRWYLGPDFLGGIDIPANLLVLSGLSAITFAGARGLTVAKKNAAIEGGNLDPKNFANAAAPPAAGVQPLIAPAASRAVPNLLRDLTTDDFGKFELGDFQMIVLMIVAVATYVAITFEFLGHIEFRSIVTLRDVDTTILSLFGVSQGAYLAKKAVGDVGKS